MAIEEKDMRFEPSTIENVDAALLDYVRAFNLHTRTNQGWQPVPVVWSGTERAHQIKENPELRDAMSVLRLPQITIERRSVSKKLNEKGLYWGNVMPIDDEKGGSIELVRKINQDKTSAFSNARSQRRTGDLNFKTSKTPQNKIVYEITSVPLPIYLTMEYVVTLRTEYQEQMNDLIAPFLTHSDGVHYFIIEKTGHRYECFYNEDYGTVNNTSNFDDQEKIYKSEVKIKVLGHIHGAGVNAIKPKRAIRENAIKVKIRESSIKPDFN